MKHNASHGSEGKQNSHMMYSKDKTELCYLQITPKENKRDNNNKPIKAKHKLSNPHKILRRERKKSSLLIEEKPKINGNHTFTFFSSGCLQPARFPHLPASLLTSKTSFSFSRKPLLSFFSRKPSFFCSYTHSPIPPISQHGPPRLMPVACASPGHEWEGPSPSLLRHMSCKRRRRRNQLPRALLTSKKEGEFM